MYGPQTSNNSGLRSLVLNAEAYGRATSAFAARAPSSNETLDADRLPPLIVYLHGFGGDLRHWQAAALRLVRIAPAHMRGSTHLLLELPGHGHSLHPFQSQGLLECIAASIEEHAQTEQKLILIGHSLGGLLALRLAKIFHSKLCGLAVFNSGLSIRLHPQIEAQANSGQWDYDFLRSGFGPAADTEIVQLIVRGFGALRIAAPLDAQWQTELSPRIQQVPVLIGMDINDRIVSVRKSEQLAHALPNAQCVRFDDTCHYPHLFDPAAVARALANHVLRDQRNAAYA